MEIGPVALVDGGRQSQIENGLVGVWRLGIAVFSGRWQVFDRAPVEGGILQLQEGRPVYDPTDSI